LLVWKQEQQEEEEEPEAEEDERQQGEPEATVPFSFKTRYWVVSGDSCMKIRCERTSKASGTKRCGNQNDDFLLIVLL
jgi:hypothetical protein